MPVFQTAGDKSYFIFQLDYSMCHLWAKVANCSVSVFLAVVFKSLVPMRLLSCVMGLLVAWRMSTISPHVLL